jgi:hypothetical protein
VEYARIVEGISFDHRFWLSIELMAESEDPEETLAR